MQYLLDQQTACVKEIREAFKFAMSDQCGFPDLVQALMWEFVNPELDLVPYPPLRPVQAWGLLDPGPQQCSAFTMDWMATCVMMRRMNWRMRIRVKRSKRRMILLSETRMTLAMRQESAEKIEFDLHV
jgi:hypothetical protein